MVDLPIQWAHGFLPSHLVLRWLHWSQARVVRLRGGGLAADFELRFLAGDKLFLKDSDNWRFWSWDFVTMAEESWSLGWKDELSIMMVVIFSFLSVVGGPTGELGLFVGEEKEKVEKEEVLWRELGLEEGEVLLMWWLFVLEKSCDCMKSVEVVAAAVISDQCRMEKSACDADGKWRWWRTCRRTPKKKVEISPNVKVRRAKKEKEKEKKSYVAIEKTRSKR